MNAGRPDVVPDECQVLPDCDGDGPPDACELEAGTQVDLDYNGIPDGCECPTDITGDGVVNVLDLIDLLLEFGNACP